MQEGIGIKLQIQLQMQAIICKINNAIHELYLDMTQKFITTCVNCVMT
jgi:hypothetical protein